MIAKFKEKNHNNNIMKETFCSTAVTMGIIEFSQVGANFLDGLIVGAFLGSEEIAAQGLAYPYFSILGVISGMLAVGTQVIVAKELARGNKDKTVSVFSMSTFVGLVISAIITSILFVFSEELASLLGATGKAQNLLNLTSKYILGLAIGTPSVILNAILTPVIQLDSNKKIVSISAMSCAVSNIILDILAVVLKLGVFGIGLATSLSNYVCLAILLTHFLRKNRMLRFSLKSIKFSDLPSVIVYGMEIVVRRIVNVIRPILLNAIVIGVGGSAAMSVLSVRNNLDNFFMIPGTGISSTVLILISIAYGETNKNEIINIGKLAHRYIFTIYALLSAVLVAFAKPIVTIYLSDSPDIIPLAVFAIRCLAISVPLKSLVTSYSSKLQAMKKTLQAQLFTIGSHLVFVTASAFVLSSILGVKGVFLAFPVSYALLLCSVMFVLQVKKRKLHITVEDYLGLGEKFNIDDTDIIEISVKSTKEVTNVSRSVSKFCAEHYFDNRKSYFSALCLEEMAGNIVEHGFTKTKKKCSVDIRVVIMEENIVMRIRDNCPAFDVVKKTMQLEDDITQSPESNIGIRIIKSITKNLQYVQTMGINVLIITV